MYSGCTSPIRTRDTVEGMCIHVPLAWRCGHGATEPHSLAVLVTTEPYMYCTYCSSLLLAVPVQCMCILHRLMHGAEEQWCLVLYCTNFSLIQDCTWDMYTYFPGCFFQDPDIPPLPFPNPHSSISFFFPSCPQPPQAPPPVLSSSLSSSFIY